jgi:hypothetical protein
MKEVREMGAPSSYLIGLLHNPSVKHMLQVFQGHVTSVCSKCFICFRRMLQAFWSGYCICCTHMLQEFVPNVSVVSFLCCSKYFMLQVFSLDVA